MLLLPCHAANPSTNADTHLFAVRASAAVPNNDNCPFIAPAAQTNDASEAVMVNVTSALGAAKIQVVHMLSCSVIADLKRAICEAPLNMFNDPSSVVLVLKGAILRDDAAIQSLPHIHTSCITAVRVRVPFPPPPPPTDPSPATSCIARGARVRIHSLKQKPELNGRTAAVFCASDDAARWLVNIDSDLLMTEQAWLRPSNLTVIPAERASDPSDPDWFDSLGLPLSCIVEFSQRNGGEAAFQGLTTSQVKRRFIMPETLGTKLSLCEQLRAAGDARVKDAQWFVSHAWQYKFLDVVSSLQAFLAAEPDGADATLWFDAFSTSQHDTYSRPPMWWQRTFVNSIGRMGRLVMVLTPWTDPVTLSRAWCILELFACVNSRSRFQVAMPPDQYQSIFDFSSHLLDDYADMLSKVQCEKSQCSRDEDRVRIFETVRASIGFLAMDRLVFDTLGGWMLQQLNAKKLDYYQKGDMVVGAKLSRKVVVLLNTLGRHFDAEDELNQAMRSIGAPQASNGVSVDVQRWAGSLPAGSQAIFCELMSDYGFTYIKLGRHDDAAAIFEHFLSTTDDSENQCNFLLNLAVSHRAARRFVEAERLYLQCLEMSRRLLGLEHADTLKCMNSLAVTYRELKKFDLSEPLFLQVIEISRRVIGENHTDTQAACVGLANCYRDQGRFSDAEPLYLSSLEFARRTKGFSHPETLDSLANLASLNGDIAAHERDRARYVAAEKMYAEAIRTGTETLGRDHPLVVRWQSNFDIDMQAKQVVLGKN
jgi:tetratricopeptide (TPR) repeat protein